MPFPNSVNQFLAPAVAGDFASTNPRNSVVAGPGGLVAGDVGVTVGAFAWQAASSASTAYVSLSSTLLNTVLGSSSLGLPTGFVARTPMAALITNYLGETSYVIPQGFGVTAYNAGDFWAVTAAACTIGQKVFANLANGSIYPGTAGSTIAGATMTATVATTVLTVSAQSVNPIIVGAKVIGLTPTTYIASFGTGNGGTGTYNLTTSGATGTATGTTNYVETSFYIAQNNNINEITIISTTPAN
jgi:hypothetical protein